MGHAKIVWSKKIWERDDVLLASIFSFSLFFAFLLVTFLVKYFKPEGSFLLALILTLGGVISLITPIFYICLRKNISTNLLGLKFLGWRWIIGAGFLSFLVMFIGATLSVFWANILSIEQESVGNILSRETTESLWLNVLYFKLFIVILVPFAEELFFRGLIFRFLRQSRGFVLSAFISSVVFAVVHLSIEALPFLIVLGLASAFVFEKSGSLLPAMFLHSVLNNIVVNFYIFSTF